MSPCHPLLSIFIKILSLPHSQVDINEYIHIGTSQSCNMMFIFFQEYFDYKTLRDSFEDRDAIENKIFDAKTSLLENQLVKSWQELDRMLFCTKLPMCVVR